MERAIELAVLRSDASGLSAWSEDALAPLQKSILVLAKKIIAGKYEEALLDTRFKDLIAQSSKGADPFESLLTVVEDFLKDAPSGQEELHQLLVLLLGIAALNVFLQSNWTGPKIAPAKPFPAFSADVQEYLGADGEQCFKFVRDPQFLALTRSLLVAQAQELTRLPSSSLWIARAAFAHQRVLSGPANSLRTVIDAQLEKALFAYTDDAKLLAGVHLECGIVAHYYRNTIEHRQHVLKAKELTGLKAEMSGALGKRTKFQTFDLAQLVLLARSKEEAPASENPQLPQTVENPDEDAPAMDHVKFTEALPDSEANLTVLDQCIILGLCLEVRNRNPKSGLTTEEMMVYVKRVLKNPNNWMVHSTALLLQARLEFENSRTMDKASIQLQVLVDQYDSDIEKDYDVALRMKHLHYLVFPPQHELKRELGIKWLKIGSASSALQLFEPLEMWDEVIECYVIREQHAKAQELVTELIKTQPTPKLLCIMGELTGKEEHFLQAWELSGRRFTRAKRSLGVMAFDKGRYAEAAVHLQEALAINPQFGSAWFRLGVVGLRLPDLTLAHKAFSRVVQLYPEDGEAWNNLGSVFVKLGKKREAYNSYKEALKNRTESHQIWENFLFVCMDLGEAFEAIYAMEQLLELKENYVDVPILKMLVNAVVKDINSGTTKVGSLLHKALDDFFTKLTSRVTSNPDLWGLYAEYWVALGSMEKAVAYRQKQCRALQVSGWEHTLPLFKKLVDGCALLVEDQLKFANAQSLYSAKLFVSGCLKKSAGSFDSTPETAELRALLGKLEAAEKK